MTKPDPPTGSEESPAANGSGPPTEDLGVEAVKGEKNHEETKDGLGTKDNVETNDTIEKVQEDTNGFKTVEDKDKDEAVGKETKDVDMAEAKEVKGVDAKDVENVTSEDAKAVAVEDVKVVGVEDTKTVDAEDVKMSDVKDATGEEKGHEIKGGEEGAGKQKEETEAVEKKDGGETEMKVDEKKEEETPKKRARSKKVRDKGKGDDEKQEGKRSKIHKESFSTPVTFSIERPVRERKTVERLVEVIEKEPNKSFIIEKGRGTPLKDIPNVAYKLAKRKPPDLKLLHQTLYGRKGKAVDFKNHILQFSGFVWHESDEKQRVKMKEKLDKYVKETLLDFCDLFDIPVSKTNIRKEDLVTKLLDFIVAPHATTDVILAEKEQATQSGKRKRVSRGGSASKSTEGTPVKASRKKFTSEDTPSTTKRSTQEEEEDEDDEEEEDADRAASTEDEAAKHSKSEEKEHESEEAVEEGDNYDSEHEKRNAKKSSKKRGSISAEKVKAGISSKKTTLASTTKSPEKTSSSKHPKAEERDDMGAKVFTRKKKLDMPKKTSTPKQEIKEKKSSGKKVAKGKGKSEEAAQSGPTKEELRKTISDILNGVDFNTATFTDILKKLAAHYKMDMAPRKTAIKDLIQEELTKLAEEAEENEENEDEEDAEQ